ncbi:MAG TPA: four helix bundle protein [bacterium]|nr:four helix bundle protein [bacterium]
MNHQKLKCYAVLLETAKRMPSIVALMPRGHSHLVDQVERALSSAILNLSEGNGRTSPKERARFFDISLGSIAETSSAIDVMQAFRLIPSSDGDEIRSSLKIAYAMIMRLKRPRV